MMKADWGEILVHDKMVNHAFLFELKGEFNYKGIDQPIKTYRLKGKIQQHKKIYEPTTSSSVNSSSSNASTKSSTNTSTTSSGRTIYTGPRGGKYYINSNGNKTYLKKK